MGIMGKHRRLWNDPERWVASDMQRDANLQRARFIAASLTITVMVILTGVILFG